jgi:hypothetical protein
VLASTDAVAELGRVARTVALYGLDQDDVGELIGNTLGRMPRVRLAARVCERTGGNRHDETRPQETAFFRSLVPGAELVVFEESSHMPHLEEPDRYLQVLRDFLHRTESALPTTPTRPTVTAPGT